VIVEPALLTEPPLQPARFPLRGATLRIGRAGDSPVRVDHPLVDARHAMLVEREDGWWITASPGRLTINGHAMERDHRLVHGDRVTLAPGATLRFDSGVVAPAPVAAPAAGRVQRDAPRRRRRRLPQLAMPSLTWRGLAPWIAVGVLLGIGGGFGWYAWRTWGTRPVTAQESDPITITQAAQLDSLLTVAYDHIERGQILVEYGANTAALDEFAAGVATITASPLRNLPYVRERAEALRASVADIYRSRNLLVPGTYATARKTVSLATAGVRAALSVEQFAAGFAAVQAEFTSRFGKALTITGSDHSEHLSLYGRGGALDLRSSTLRPEQVQFVIATARAQGIRVKDFSQDAVLRAQIAAAIKAGLRERAGTGLHLHIDRFANRRDRYTVP